MGMLWNTRTVESAGKAGRCWDTSCQQRWKTGKKGAAVRCSRTVCEKSFFRMWPVHV